MNLIIVESPTKARTLNRFLGKDFHVEATLGHIKDLPKSKLSVDVEHNFKPDYVVVEKREKEIKKLQSEAKKAKMIFLATDPDREGEAIAKHVEEVIRGQGLEVRGKSSEASKRKTKLQALSSNVLIKRIVFHEITKEAVEEAIKNPGKVNKDLVNAQIARRVLDRLVGYKLSPLLWRKVRRGLSAGRVQSVVVRLIVEREKEIEAFKADEYWEIFVEVRGQRLEVSKESFIVRLIKINDRKAEVKNKKDADGVVGDLKKAQYSVFDVVKKEVNKGPYPPFTTSTMTQAAARLFYWSSKKTMSVAQALYEDGLITYHRTDSVHMAQKAVDAARKYIGKNYGENYLPEKPRFYKTRSKSAQEAHEAIRPTNVNVVDAKPNTKFKKDAEKLYDLIWKRFVSCQMANSVYDQTRIDVVASVHSRSEREDTPGVKYLLRTTGQIMKFDGWRKVFGGKPQNGEVTLPDVQKDDPLKLIKVDPQQKFTQPPPRYNEASLIKTLEKLGIGRPSTYAPTISTILYRKYAEKEEGKFKPTSIGVAVNSFLTKNFESTMDYQFTAEMEGNLDDVAKGEKKWTEMMEKFYTPFEKKVKGVEKNAKRVKIPVEKLGRKCPKCRKDKVTESKRGELVIRVGRFGKFISCSRFPDCDYTEKYVEKIGMKCPDCESKDTKPVGEIIVKKTGKGRMFYGCSNYPNCKWASWKNPRREENRDK